MFVLASNETAVGNVPSSVQGGLPPLPNPFTPLAFLPPDLARQYTVAMFVVVACVTVLLWDILNNLRSDYRLVKEHRIGLPGAVYFFSRIMNLTCLLAEVVLMTAPTGNCKTMAMVATAFLPLSIPSTSLLLFFQVRAIYIRNRIIVTFFSIMWVAVLATCAIQVIAATTGTEIGLTKYCVVDRKTAALSAAPAIVTLANDTLMFSAIVYKVFQCSMEDYSNSGATMGRFKTFFFGRSLPRLSKALLQNGQAYFLSTVGISLITVIMFYINAIPPIYRDVMGFPDIALMNIMASRIYRNTKLGTFDLPTLSINTLSNGLYSGSQRPGGVVVEVTRKLEQSPPSMETLNSKTCSGMLPQGSSSTFNVSKAHRDGKES